MSVPKKRGKKKQEWKVHVHAFKSMCAGVLMIRHVAFHSAVLHLFRWPPGKDKKSAAPKKKRSERSAMRTEETITTELRSL